MRSDLRSEPLPDPYVRRWIRRDLAASPPRASSLMITVWGDAIAPHGGAVMLNGLFNLVAPFGINERQARTSLFRLTREHWLSATRVGRRSLYRLTREGARRFEQAYRRIYASPDATWDASWEIVVAERLRSTERRALQEELSWEGFGTLAPGVFARPSRGPSAVQRIVDALGIAERVVVARAGDDAALGGRTLASAVPRAWDLASVATEYRRFLARFGGVIQRFQDPAQSAHDPEQSFLVRMLLIHAYRRVLLRDPQLPAALLPLDWPGAAAYTLCRDFYRLTHRAAERHLLATLANEHGELPPASPAFYERFGRLAD